MPKLQEKSVFQWFVAAVDGLFVKTKALTARDNAYAIAHYSGSKCGYGINIQILCTADYRFYALPAIAPGSTIDWMTWTRSFLYVAVSRLPSGFHIVGDSVPGEELHPGGGYFKFHFSQLCIKI